MEPEPDIERPTERYRRTNRDSVEAETERLRPTNYRDSEAERKRQSEKSTKRWIERHSIYFNPKKTVIKTENRWLKFVSHF